MKVLVADDSAGQRRYCRIVLESAGVEVAEAADGRIALAMMQAETFDLLVLDLNMPVLDGIEVLRLLPSTPMCGGPPAIVVCSSQTNEFASRYAGEFAQVACMLQKPTEPGELLNAVNLALEFHEERRHSVG